MANAAASEARVVFRGVANPAEEITESTLSGYVHNRLNLQRIVLPEVQNLAAVSVDVSGDELRSGRGVERRREGKIFGAVQMRIFAGSDGRSGEPE